MTMVPPESLLFSGYVCGHDYGYQGGCGGRGFSGMMKGTNDHDHVEFSNGDACSISDRIANINGTHNSSSNNISMAADVHLDDSRTNNAKEDAGSVSKDIAVPSANADNNTRNSDFDEDYMKDEGWLRLGIGLQTENLPETAKREGSSSHINDRHDADDDQANRKEDGREGLLELNLFSGGCERSYSAEAAASVYHAPPPPQHHQLLINNPFGASLFYQRFFRPQLLHQNPSSISSSSSCSPSPSTPWMPLMGPYNFARPFHPPLGVYNNIFADVAAGPSSDFRVVDPPRRPHSGIWFVLQASQNQAKEPFLPQVNKSYLRIKDGRMTVRLLMKYLMKKLQLDSESEIEIRCRGEELSPLLTLQHVRDTIWSAKDSSSSLTLLPDSSTDHVMVLHYGRSA